MAAYGYSELVGGPCGCNSSNLVNAVCETIERMRKKLQGSFEIFDCFDSTLQTEADLLLVRAGNKSIFVIICVEDMQSINNAEE